VRYTKLQPTAVRELNDREKAILRSEGERFEQIQHEDIAGFSQLQQLLATTFRWW